MTTPKTTAARDGFDQPGSTGGGSNTPSRGRDSAYPAADDSAATSPVADALAFPAGCERGTTPQAPFGTDAMSPASGVPAGLTPYYSDDRATLYKGDALAVLAALPAASVDALITDPPYSSGGMVRGDRQAPTEQKYRGWSHSPTETRRPTAIYDSFTGDNRDQRGYLYWFGLWAGEARRVAKPGAHFLCFTDWRQLPTTTDAMQIAGWVWRGIAVWDKGIGRPMRGRFRNHIEYLVWGTNGPVAEEDCYLDSVFRVAPPRPNTRVHLTEKPLALLTALMPLVPEGGAVLDPFAGSATTGVAALTTGRRFVGAELTEHYAEVAASRLRTVARGYRDDGQQAALDFGEATA